MATYKAPLGQVKFLLEHVFDANSHWASLPGTEEISAELVDAVLEQAARLVEGELLPINRNGDEQGCAYADGVVTTPAGFREAYQQFAANGWPALTGDPEYGGQGMPKSLAILFDEMLHAANSSFALYPLLTNGAALCLEAHGTEEQKSVYLPKLYSGEWAGTMCLTEAHSGSDLGLMRTRADANDDGSFSITGSKMFITGGEHDLTDNIIHLVLARLPDAPAGSRGISLFLVPKFLPSGSATTGERNGVRCGSIEHKMGIKGSATCVMNFDDARGWLVGEPHQGLAAMFTMMNFARISIGLQGVGLGEASYQSAVEYARDRLQGKAVSRQGQGEADAIIQHPDVRRMLLTMRAFNEAGRALSVWMGLMLDRASYANDKVADEQVALLTPVAKAFFTDRGLETCVLGQQVFGGHGYIREWGMEQFVRDVRIAQIYEGTNGIQALDLVSRKLGRDQGACALQLVAVMQQWSAAQAGNNAVAAWLPALDEALLRLQGATSRVVQMSAEDGAAVACEYLDLFGYVLYAWMWARMMAAAPALADLEAQRACRVTGSFYFERILPRTTALELAIRQGAGSMMELAAESF